MSNKPENVTAAPRAPPDVAGDEKESEPRQEAIPNRMEFIDMPGKEPHWEVTHFGEAIIPSPIRVLPKPLALSYRNFFNHYEEYEFTKREKQQTSFPRLIVGCSFVSAMLRHYFPSREYAVREAWPGTSTGAEFTPLSAVDGVPVVGTRHWIVQKHSDAAVAVLVVVVTDPEFSKLPARTKPAQLAVAANFIDSSYRLAVHGDRMSRGVVVLLASAGIPVKPTFEFYNFDSSHAQNGVLAPSAPQDVVTNNISLDPDHAEQVDQMFKIIVHASSGRGIWAPDLLLSSTSVATSPGLSSTPAQPVLALPSSSTPVASTLAQTTKRKARATPKATPEPKMKRSKKIESLGNLPLASLPLAPALSARSSPTVAPDHSTRHNVDVKNDKTRKMEHHELSEAYVRTVKKNKAGNLIEENGKMIQNGKSKAIRQIAEIMGHTFRKPDHSK